MSWEGQTDGPIIIWYAAQLSWAYVTRSADMPLTEEAECRHAEVWWCEAATARQIGRHPCLQTWSARRCNVHRRWLEKLKTQPQGGSRCAGLSSQKTSSGLIRRKLQQGSCTTGHHVLNTSYLDQWQKQHGQKDNLHQGTTISSGKIAINEGKLVDAEVTGATRCSWSAWHEKVLWRSKDCVRTS